MGNEKKEKDIYLYLGGKRIKVGPTAVRRSGGKRISMDFFETLAKLADKGVSLPFSG